MPPGSEDEEDAVVGGVLGLERPVDRRGAVDVFLIEEAVYEQHRHGERPRGEHAIDRLVAPVGVVGGMGEELAPEADLLHAPPPPELSRRAGGEVHLVVVVVRRVPLDPAVARRLLLPDVGHPLLAERSVVEPVVAAPAVDHRVHRHRDLEGGMRVGQRHERREAVVGDAEDADPSVGLGDVRDQPLDGVPGVGRVIDRGRVLRSGERPVDHVVPLRAVLAAHVLDHPDVAPFDHHVGGVVVAVDRRPEVGAGIARGHLLGVVGGAGEQHRRLVRPGGQEDHRVELDAVPHRDLDGAADVVVAVGRRDDFGGGFARVVGVARGGRSRGRLGVGRGGGRPAQDGGDRQRKAAAQRSVDRHAGLSSQERVAQGRDVRLPSGAVSWRG